MARRMTFWADRPRGILPPRISEGRVEISLPARNTVGNPVMDWVGVELVEDTVYLVVKLEWRARGEFGGVDLNRPGRVHATGSLHLSEEGWRTFGIALASGDDPGDDPVRMFEGAWQITWREGFEFADPERDDVTAEVKVVAAGVFELPNEVVRMKLGIMATGEETDNRKSEGEPGLEGSAAQSEGWQKDRESINPEGTKGNRKEISTGESSGKAGGSRQGTQGTKEGRNKDRTSPRNSEGALPKKVRVTDTRRKLPEIDKRTAEYKARLIEEMMTGNEKGPLQEEPQDERKASQGEASSSEGGLKKIVSSLARALNKNQGYLADAKKKLTFDGANITEFLIDYENLAALLKWTEEEKMDHLGQHVSLSLGRDIMVIVAASRSWKETRDVMMRKYLAAEKMAMEADLAAVQRKNFATYNDFLREFTLVALRIPGVTDRIMSKYFLRQFFEFDKDKILSAYQQTSKFVNTRDVDFSTVTDLAEKTVVTELLALLKEGEIIDLTGRTGDKVKKGIESLHERVHGVDNKIERMEGALMVMQAQVSRPALPPQEAMVPPAVANRGYGRRDPANEQCKYCTTIGHYVRACPKLNHDILKRCSRSLKGEIFGPQGERVNWNSPGGMRPAIIMLNRLKITAVEVEPVGEIIWDQLRGRGPQANFILESDGRDRVNATTRLGTAGRRINRDTIMAEVAGSFGPQAEPEAEEPEKVYGKLREEEPADKEVTGSIRGAGGEIPFAGYVTKCAVKAGVRESIWSFQWMTVMEEMDHDIILGRPWCANVEMIGMHLHDGSYMVDIEDPVTGRGELLRLLGTRGDPPKGKLATWLPSFEDSTRKGAFARMEGMRERVVIMIEEAFNKKEWIKMGLPQKKRRPKDEVLGVMVAKESEVELGASLSKRKEVRIDVPEIALEIPDQLQLIKALKYHKAGVDSAALAKFEREVQKGYCLNGKLTSKDEAMEKEEEVLRVIRERRATEGHRIPDEVADTMKIGINEFLTEEETRLIKRTCQEFHLAFAFSDHRKGRLDAKLIPPVRIHTVEHERWNDKGPSYEFGIAGEVTDLLRAKMDSFVAEPTTSSCANRWFVFRKPNKTLRWIQDLQKLNAVTIRDAGSLPQADLLAESHVGRSIYSLIDLYSGYDQLPLDVRDRPYTAMHTPVGQLQMQVTPMGFTNAVAEAQRRMLIVVGDMLPEKCEPYIDDNPIKGAQEKDETEVQPGIRRFVWDHLQDIKDLLRRFLVYNITASGPKSILAVPEVTILGFRGGAYGRKPDPAKIDKISQWPTPLRTTTKVRAFLGVVGFWRIFIKNFAKIAEPIRTLIREEGTMDWTEEREGAVQRLKFILTSETSPCTRLVLMTKWDDPFILETNGGPLVVEGVFIQRDEGGKERPIRFKSRTLNSAERRYSQFKGEVLAILHCLKTFQAYLFGRRFILRIDPTNVAGALKNYRPIDPAVGRWVGFIWQFDYKIERIAGIRNKAYGLSRVCITPEGLADAEPIDAFLEYEGGTIAMDNEMMSEGRTSIELLIQTLEKGAPAVVAELTEGPVTTR
ncbi:hypothetical protein CBR_g26436 [Chara braunii]|uniref:Uncharacterized protein n=1 Tax=Chara braunii TaxID=69332 RepID=A0A388L803_CHABU|nr:hypothetical protein CBR_g26436 [Chara braunii]|eukprot:GBG78408.1 hypothetical protein CBR_g26436 [Chara braunii]